MGDGGGGQWLVRMEWRPAELSMCLPLLIFPCAIKSRRSLGAGSPGWSRKKGRKTVVVCGWWWKSLLMFTKIPYNLVRTNAPHHAKFHRTRKVLQKILTLFSISAPQGDHLGQSSPILALIYSKAPCINLPNFIDFVDGVTDKKQYTICLRMHTMQRQKNLRKPRLHDTTCCQTGLTTRWMFVYTIQPVVKSRLTTGCIVYTAGCQTRLTTGWQPVVSCKRGIRNRNIWQSINLLANCANAKQEDNKSI